MKKLIITADDYGMSKAVNAAIDEGIEKGLITSTNVMVNMPEYKEAVKLKKIEGVSVGLHWTLACGFPVSSPEDIPSLVSESGGFYPYDEFRARYRKGLIKNEDIYKELVAQYNVYKELMGEPDYWNTHENTHVDFKIYGVFVDLAKNLGINKMRSHQRIYVPQSQSDNLQPLKWRLIEPLKSKLLDIWQGKAHKKGIASPDGLIVCLNNSDVNFPEYVFSNIRWKNKQIGEYVIHPAKENDSPYFGNIVDQRIGEFEMFTSDKTVELLKKAAIQLVSYDAVEAK